MTDARTRSLERSATAGDLDASVRLLVARRRSGDRDAGARLRLAAYCGHVEARQAMDLDLVMPDGSKRIWKPERNPLPAWLTGLPGADLDVGEREVRCNGLIHITTFRDDHGKFDVERNKSAHESCEFCKGTDAYRVPRDGSAYLAQRCAIVAGRLALFVYEKRDAAWYLDLHGPGRGDAGADPRPRAALNAAWEHLLCGTLVAHEAWRDAWTEAPDLEWLVSPGDAEDMMDTVLASARELGSPCEHSGDGTFGPPGFRFDCTICNGTGRMPDESRVREALASDLVAWALS